MPTDPLKAAENVMRAKQMLYKVAVNHHMALTLMARPTESYGSRMHVQHFLHYLNDAEDTAGDLAFYDLSAAVSLLCPTIYSYRRMSDFSTVPTGRRWGKENKSTALRLVSHSPSASRIEHRLGAADMNPDTAMPVILWRQCPTRFLMSGAMNSRCTTTRLWAVTANANCAKISGSMHV